MAEPESRTAASEPRDPWYGRLWARMHRGDSIGWLICTILQGLLTWGFIGLSKLSEGWAWEAQAKTLVLVAIVSTWVMALRTIRVRIIELLRFWALARKAKGEQVSSEREERLEAARTEQVRRSVLQLRIIAAGITLPFFVLPAFVSALCVGMCFWYGVMDASFLKLALLLSVLAAVVGTYFHWAVVPKPAASTARRVVRERPAKELQGSRVG